MEGQSRVLQQRIEAAAVGRRGYQPIERVGSEQDEKNKPDGDEALHAKHPGSQALR